MDDKTAARLFRTYSKRLYNTALRLVSSEDEAAEIMQETLIRYIAKEDDGSVRMIAGASEEMSQKRMWAYLRTICVRLSVDCLRRQKRFVSMEDPDIGDDDGYGLIAEDSDSDDALWDGLDGELIDTVIGLIRKMPAGYRTVLMLKLVEDMDYPEIARQLDISETGVRSQYMRGKRKLADELKRILDKGQAGRK